MKTSKKQLADQKLAIETLRHTPYGVLATVDDKGQPHAATVIVVVNDDLTVNFITRAMTNKHKNLLLNSRVAMAIGSVPPFAFQLRGRAREVKAAKEVASIMEKWAVVGSQLKDIWPPVLRMGQAPYVVFSIKPTRLTAIDLRGQTLNTKVPPFVRIR